MRSVGSTTSCSLAALVGLSLLACSGVEAPAPVPPPPAPEPPRQESGERLLPVLPDRGGDERPADCTLDLDGLTPMLKLRQPEGRAPARMEVKKGAVVERVALDDGTVVRLSRYGCAHYGETWEIAPVPADEDPREAAIARLGRLATASGDPPSIIDTLKRAPGIAEDGSFSCGDAVCSIRAEGGVVTVLYDFPL